MKIILKLILIILILSSCSQNGKSMFEFNEVTHYMIDADSVQYKLLISKEEKAETEQDKTLVKVFQDNYPNDFNDEKFLTLLRTSKSIHGKIINKKFYPELRKTVFVITDIENTEEFACIPEYRDIFVFHKDGQVTGVAKICFHCNQSVLIPSSLTNTFGASGEFDHLEAILKKDNGL